MTRTARTYAVHATVAQLEQHARDLAAAFKVRLVMDAQVQPHEAFALPQRRLVVMSRIVDDTTYAVALHEMGHVCAALGVVDGLVDGDPQRLRQLEEDAAWTWAAHHALIWTPAMDAVAAWAEGTYQTPPQAPRKPSQPQIDWRRYR